MSRWRASLSLLFGGIFEYAIRTSSSFMFSLSIFLFSFFLFCLVLCLFLYFRGLFDVGSTLAEEKKAERERRGITSWKVDVFVNGLCWRGGVSDVHRNSINLNWNTTVAFVRPCVCMRLLLWTLPTPAGLAAQRSEKERDGYEKVRFYKCVQLLSGSESKSERE